MARKMNGEETNTDAPNDLAQEIGVNSEERLGEEESAEERFAEEENAEGESDEEQTPQTGKSVNFRKDHAGYVDFDGLWVSPMSVYQEIKTGKLVKKMEPGVRYREVVQAGSGFDPYTNRNNVKLPEVKKFVAESVTDGHSG